jgi:hypothetical protein
MLTQKIILTLGITFMSFYLVAQSVEDLTSRHYSDQKKGMTILGAWGLGNLITGVIGSSISSESEVMAFHQMNAGWGLVNVGIAGIGYFTSRKKTLVALNDLSLLNENHKLKSTLLFNAGLDLGYMATGLYLIEKDKSATENNGRLKGFGKSLIMQGAFLFAFDLGTYLNFNQQTKDVLKLFANDGQIGVAIKL